MVPFSFANGVTLKLSIQNGFYLGIEEARLEGEVFLVAGRGSRPYCVTPDGIAYTQFRILDRVPEGETIEKAPPTPVRAAKAFAPKMACWMPEAPSSPSTVCPGTGAALRPKFELET